MPLGDGEPLARLHRLPVSIVDLPRWFSGTWQVIPRKNCRHNGRDGLRFASVGRIVGTGCWQTDRVHRKSP